MQLASAEPRALRGLTGRLKGLVLSADLNRKDGLAPHARVRLRMSDGRLTHGASGFDLTALRLDLPYDSDAEGGAAQGSFSVRLGYGDHELGQLQGLDEEDRVIAQAILRGLQDPKTLPDPQHKADPTLAAPGLAHMISEAGRGNVQALTLVSQMAEQMSRVGGDMGRVAAVIRPMINGERDPETLCSKMDARGRQLVLQILDELGKRDLH